jgi:cobalamin biosynthesis Mg chelatase CobN
MADEELHETDSNDPKDQQGEALADAAANTADGAAAEPAVDAAADTAADTAKNDAAARDDAAEGKASGKATDKTSDDEAGTTDDSDNDTYGVDMDQVEAVLNANVDKATMTPQMQRMLNRQAESTKRVEETIKGTKSNPRWFVPLFCTLMIVGLIWCVVYYLSPNGSVWPIPNIGAWNLAIGFALVMIGFLMTMGWR